MTDKRRGGDKGFSESSSLYRQAIIIPVTLHPLDNYVIQVVFIGRFVDTEGGPQIRHYVCPTVDLHRTSFRTP